MSRMSDFEIELRNIIEEYKRTHEPISIAVKDISQRYNVSVHHVYNYIDMYLQEDSGGSMSFAGNKDISKDYVEKRFKGDI